MCLGQYLKSHTGQRSVFAGQGNYVSERCYRNQIAVLGQHHLLHVIALGLLFQRRDQLEGHSSAAQIAAGGILRRKGRIQDRIGRRQLLRQRMVVGHDHFESGFFRAADLLQRRNAVIDRYNQLDPRGDDGLHRCHGKAVALPDSLGDIVADIGPFALQILVQQHRSSDAVAIVVAKDQYFFPFIDCPPNHNNRAVHIAQEHWVA